MIEIDLFEILLITLLYGHLSAAAYEIYYHRGLVHEKLIFSPFLSFLFQFWIWLTFEKMPSKSHLCSHKIHHVYSDTVMDPHGPISLGLKKQFFLKPFYRSISQLIRTFSFKKKIEYPLTELQEKFLGNLNNFNTKNFFYRKCEYGNFIFLLINLVLFGINGIVIYVLFVFQINILRDVIADGLTHWFGYRNYSTEDNSRNIFPIGIFLCGIELNNNHHGNSNEINYRRRWFEIDIGWVYIKILQCLKLCSIK